MALSSFDDTISSDRSPHTARKVPGEEDRWRVSWLPGRRMNLQAAAAAMLLADVTSTSDFGPERGLWIPCKHWAAELGLTIPEVLTLTGNAPEPAVPETRPATQSLDWDLSDLDPEDLEHPWTELPEDEYPDAGWPGFRRPNGHVPNIYVLAVSPVLKERYPDKAANLYDILRGTRTRQAASEPDRVADREAGE